MVRQDRNRFIKLNLLNVVVFSLCFIIVFNGNIIIKDIKDNMKIMISDIEQQWRSEARYSISTIISQLDEDSKKGNVDLCDNESLYNWAVSNFSDVKVGNPTTSTGWIAELGSEEYIYIQDVSYIKEDIDYKHFKDQILSNPNNKLLEKAINRIKVGIPSQYGEDITWKNNNGSNKWIEFGYYPLKNGVDGESMMQLDGTYNEDYRRIVVVMESNSDDVINRYDNHFLRQTDIVEKTSVLMISSIILGVAFLLYIFVKHTV